MVNGAKAEVEEPMLHIEKYENEVYKLVCLVQNEFTGLKLEDIINAIQGSLETSQARNEERRKRISAWINGIDTKNTYETALQYHHSGTCEWALSLPEFCAWDTGESPGPRLLWIYGPAGFGKTFISAWIIQHLQKKKKAPVSYFFCVADNQLTRDPYSILRSWLTQLLEQDEGILPAMDDVYRLREQEQTLTYLGLWELFCAVGMAVEGCTFVIDGFDECIDINTGVGYHRNDPRNYFLRDLLKNLSRTKSRVLIVSRDVPDISEYLGRESIHDPSIQRFEYGITAKDTTADVKSFSEFVVNSKLAKKKEELRQEIANQAAERSEGMFLWIKLLEREISPGQNAKQLSKTVREMPSGISEAYSRELEKISQQPQSQRAQAVMILRWTLFSVRPLKVKELVEALAVSEDELEGYPEDDLPDSWLESFVDEDYVKEMILSPCGSLLQLRSNTADLPLADHTVHFVHFSVKEYLCNLSTATSPNNWVTELGLADVAVEEIRLSKICLRYLTLDTFEDVPQDTSIYPFLSYASWAWYFHSFHNKPKPSQEVMNQALKAFDPATSSWKIWTPVMEAELTEWSGDDMNFDATSESDTTSESDATSEISSDSNETASSSMLQNPIYYAALLGLTDIVQWLEDKGLDCNCAGGYFGFPLQAAVARNHEDVVKHLLDRKVDVLQEGGEFGSAIIAAAEMASPAIMKLLLAAKADATVKDGYGWTPLHFAARRGNTAIVELLLEGGADINAMTHQSQTATSIACGLNQKEVVSVLVKNNANLDVADSPHPLQEAIRCDDEDIVGILLDNGCNPNTIFQNGFSALHLSIRSPKLVKELLIKGADPNLVDRIEWAPLEAAAATGTIEVVQKLIDSGATVSGTSDSKYTPLQVAIANDQLPAVKLLHKHGADVNQTKALGITALIFAVGKNSQESVDLLLNLGAKMQCLEESSQQSLFDIAIRDDHLDLVEFLVQRGCFQTTTDTPEISGVNHSKESLVMLAYMGDIKGIENKILSLDSPLPVSDLGEALHAASAMGHLSVVQFLLRKGARVNKRDDTGRTALHYAAKYLREDVADFLVESGANLSLEDNIGSTPIDLAVSRGMEASSFIQKHMDDFTVNISRRPSLLAVTPNQSTDLTIMRSRGAMSGSWSGYYDYMAWSPGRQDSFELNIPAKPPQDSRPSTFSNEGEDTVGKFQFHGFVDPAGVIWFVKLYKSMGWLYRGQVDPKELVLKGTWGRNRKLWCGTFKLTLKH
jgi:ankyrin repeat protein